MPKTVLIPGLKRSTKPSRPRPSKSGSTRRPFDSALLPLHTLREMPPLALGLSISTPCPPLRSRSQGIIDGTGGITAPCRLMTRSLGRTGSNAWFTPTWPMGSPVFRLVTPVLDNPNRVRSGPRIQNVSEALMLWLPLPPAKETLPRHTKIGWKSSESCSLKNPSKHPPYLFYTPPPDVRLPTIEDPPAHNDPIDCSISPFYLSFGFPVVILCSDLMFLTIYEFDTSDLFFLSLIGTAFWDALHDT